MASEQTALNIMGKALWDPHPTKTDLRARQLAVALGYPLEWRVVRTIEKMELEMDTNIEEQDTKKDETATTSIKHEASAKTDKTPAMATAVSATSTAPESASAAMPSASATPTAASAEALSATLVVAPDVTSAATPEATSATLAACLPIVAPTTQPAAPVGTSASEEIPGASTKETEPSTNVHESDDTKPAAKAMPMMTETATTPTIDTGAEPPIKPASKTTRTATTPTIETRTDPPIPSKSPDGTKQSGDIDKPREKKVVSVIVDRIYAGKPGTGCDMWVHHEAAMQAAQAWIIDADDNDDMENVATSGKGPTPFDHKGGHLLPRLPRFSKGDKVQVLYQDDWWDARILRRKEHAEAGFRYQVQYIADHSKQSGVEEKLIRPIQGDTDALATAASIGMVEGGWKAYVDGHHKWKIESPDGTIYRSKRAALDAYAKEYKQPQQEDNIVEEGDPPWRTAGHDYLGRHVLFVQHHQVSARRSVRVEQIGKVTGWISETDVDKAGEPGFVSEKTGAPAPLFHVVFDDKPNHPYASMLVQSQDLEEYELLECLLKEEEYRPHKKVRKR